MTARPLRGHTLARTIKERIRSEVAGSGLKSITLAAIDVSGGNGEAQAYASSLEKSCSSVGFGFRLHSLPSKSSEADVAELIERLNGDRRVHGVLLFRPLPDGLDASVIAGRIAPSKDVEGMHPVNLGSLICGASKLVPCTAYAAVALLHTVATTLRGLEVVVVNHSEIVGKPIALLMVHELATVTICHIGTTDLAAHTRRADVLFSGSGVPHLIGGDMLKPGGIVIDIGYCRIAAPDGGDRERVVGDVDFEAALPIAGWITPVPGGVGPVTTAMLLSNTMKAASKVNG